MPGLESDEVVEAEQSIKRIPDQVYVHRDLFLLELREAGMKEGRKGEDQVRKVRKGEDQEGRGSGEEGRGSGRARTRKGEDQEGRGSGRARIR
jgi:hypothetical protein